MKDELSNKLVEVIGVIQNGVGKASDFAVEQLPDIAQQYIVYGRVYETTIFVLFILAFIVLCVVVWVAIENEPKLGEAVIPLTLFPGFAAMMCLVFAYFNIANLMMVWFAPKIYLIKGLAGLIK